MHSRLLATIALFGVFGAATAQAASVVTLSPAAAHPSQAVAVSGTGFGDIEPVDIYVDTVETSLLATSATGTLSAAVTVPAAAQPGVHYITAIGRKSGDIAQATITVTTPWAEFGYGQAHLGLNPYENTLTTSNVSSLGISWSVAGPGGGSGGTPAIMSGTVIAGGLKGVQALRASNGAVLWTKITTDAFYDSPAVSGQNVFIGSNTGYLYNLNLSTGATDWTKHLDTSGRWYSSPVVAGNIVYVGIFGGGNNGSVVALNVSTGATIWTYKPGGVITSSPTVANGILYIGSLAGNVVALNATTGALLWSYQTNGEIESSAAVSNGVVYVGSDDNNVYALTAGATGGTKLWSYATGNSVTSSPAVANGSVFVGSTDKTMYALNAHTGALQWSIPANAAPSTASVANGVVYFSASDRSIYAVDATDGEILAAGTLGSDLYGGPAVSDGAVYLNANESTISAIALQGGTGAAKPVAPRLESLHPDYRLTETP